MKNTPQKEEPEAKADRICEILRRRVGTTFLQELEDPKTIEIMLNPDGKLWVEKLGAPMQQIGSFSPYEAQAILETIAGFHAREVTPETPILECEFPLDQSRFAGQLPPVVSAASFAIRKKAVSVFTLEDYEQNGIMTAQQRETICRSIADKKNILVVGGTSSGKTTLVNAIIREIGAQDPDARLVTIEDTAELQITAENHVSFYTTVTTSMTHLLKTTLRMRPDRICVGETRGAEALDLLQAWNTGHPGGAATIHANSAIGGVWKMVSYVSMNPNAPRSIEPLVGEGVNTVVFISKTKEGRRLRSLLSVEGYDTVRNQFVTQEIT